MKTRDTIILVVLAHVGLILIFICMGGCSFSKRSTDVTTMPADVAVSETTGYEDDVIRTEEDVYRFPTAESRQPVAAIEPLGKETVAPEGTGEISITVKPGDSLWAISRRYGITVKAIKERNGIEDAGLIRAGQKLIIPGVSTSLAAREEAPATVPAKPEKIELTGAEPGGEYRKHIVEAGETLWDLARKYNTTSTTIMELNNIDDPKRLQVGQVLLVPAGTE